MGKIEIDEKILYEVLVKYIGSKFDTKLILTDKRIIFERKKEKKRRIHWRRSD